MMVWRTILYLYSFGVFASMCLVFIPVVLPLALLPSRVRQRFQRVIRVITHRAFIFVRWHCHITGFATMRLLDRSGAQSSQLLVANHVSMFDIVLLFSYFPEIHTLVNAKFMKNPLLWPIIRACGYIPLRTDRPEDGLLAYQSLTEVLQSGHMLVLFPEGTRSPDGKLGPLKNGPFRVAVELKVAITPVFFTCNQPFLNRRAFVPRELGQVLLEAHILPSLPLAADSATARQDFLLAYTNFIKSPEALNWNRAL